LGVGLVGFHTDLIYLIGWDGVAQQVSPHILISVHLDLMQCSTAAKHGG